MKERESIEDKTEEEAKLLALLIDTEGSISTTMFSSRWRHYGRPTISVMMRSLLPLIYAKKWGVGVVGKLRHRDGKIGYCWQINKRKLVRSILLKIKPYLILKREQANLSLQTLDILDRKLDGWQDKTRQLKTKISELNHAPAPDIDIEAFCDP